MVRVGIPRALLYYYYYPLWRAFLTALGANVVVSPPTNKKILDSGLQTALDEACLPVKLFFGHVLTLTDKVDYLFVPRLVSVEEKAYICPKFMGLPDMLRARVPNLPPLIDTTIDLRRPESSLNHALEEFGSIFTRDRCLIKRACEVAHSADQQFQEYLCKGFLPSDVLSDKFSKEDWKSENQTSLLKIGLLGHPYNLYDHFISMNLIRKLRQMGAKVISADSLPPQVIEENARKLPKRLFWTLGKKMIGAALNFFETKDLDGIIYLTSFGCGPESLIGELVERWARHCATLPFMLLTIDEHTGEAGLITRIEAFIEMIVRRRKNENHLSPHGQFVHCH